MKSIKEYIHIFILVFIITFIIYCMVTDVNSRFVEPSAEQLNCEHEWYELGASIINFHDIYCPKCKKEERVTNSEWKKIKIDSEFAEQNKVRTSELYEKGRSESK